MTKTSLYRHFDTNGQLLYVGISKGVMARISGHQRDSGWFWDIATITLQTFSTREEALYAEAVAIRDENPKYNKARPVPVAPGLREEIEQPEESPPTYISFVFPEASAEERIVGYTIVESPDDDLSWLGAALVYADLDGESFGLQGAAKMALALDGVLVTDQEALLEGAPFTVRRVEHHVRA